jgi:DNA-binding CsgD family transcriptional regulator
VVLVFALEGFASHEASRNAVAALNQFRPHIGRAMLFSERIERDKGTAILDAFEMCGMPLALIGYNGELIGANELFRERAEGLVALAGMKMSAADPRTREGLDQAIQQLVTRRIGSSLALRSTNLRGEAVMHLMPRSDRSMHMFSKIAGFTLLTTPGNKALPNADIIAALFDLTVAESRIARMIAQGQTIKDVAAALHLSEATVRTHLKSIFQKTSVSRQSELVLLLNRFR